MFNPAWFKHLQSSARTGTPVADGEHLGVSPCALVPHSLLLPSHPVLVAWASQMGAAEVLARETVERLEAADVPVHCVDFNALRLSLLEDGGTALFVASTTYDGDPPDMAEAFNRDVMARSARLFHLRYGLLALGDCGYAQFCGFGRKLHAWLQASGAQTCFAPIEVDDEDAGALRQWRQQVDGLCTTAHRIPV